MWYRRGEVLSNSAAAGVISNLCPGYRLFMSSAAVLLLNNSHLTTRSLYGAFSSLARALLMFPSLVLCRYVGNLPSNVTEGKIMELFQRVGPIKHCKVLYPVSGPSHLCVGAVGPAYRGGVCYSMTMWSALQCDNFMRNRGFSAGWYTNSKEFFYTS